MEPVLTRQPPGKRRKPGFSAAIFSARSLRRPLGWFLYVSRGNSDTMSRAASAAVATVRRPRLLVREAVNVALYCVQPPRTATLRVSARVPAASFSVTVRVAPASARAHTEKSYRSPFSTRTPVL
ncbi:hypothetical protein SALBM217S_08938 [Streptomyces griseoloalbus]